MKHLKWLLIVLLTPIILVVSAVSYILINDYRPDWEEESLSIIRNGKPLDSSKPLDITTFNIGYGGLDKNQDFFMDGGTMSRSSSKEQTQINLDAMIRFLKEKKSDIYLLQEVDVKAARSFDIDQVDLITGMLPGYNASFAYNYKAKTVPVPISHPMGAVESGLLTLSKADFENSKRLRLPGDEPIPKRYFDLKRCVMENTYHLSNGMELIVVNVHLSAFDEGGKIRAQQIEWLSNYLQKRYNKERNYILVGGDWNHLLSSTLQDKIVGEMPEWVAILPDSLEDETGFHAVYDEKANTVRSNEKAYVAGENFETIIDGYLVSPNLKVLGVKGTDLGFEHTDHQPVTITIGF